jgi:hypothetical protein
LYSFTADVFLLFTEHNNVPPVVLFGNEIAARMVGANLLIGNVYGVSDLYYALTV